MHRMKQILVTGGNSGIGLALCRQLAVDGHHVFMCSRDVSRGGEALASLDLDTCLGSISLVQLDVGDIESVSQAAESVQKSLNGSKLYAVVNNAGIGLAAHADATVVVKTNLYGVKLVTEAFLPMVSDRIVNVGSGAGPIYVSKCPLEAQKRLSCCPDSWEEIESWLEMSDDGLTGVGSKADTMGGYGISKALLASYTMLMAKEVPQVLFSSVSPGFIETKLTAGFGATKSTEEGTVSIKKALFDELEGNGRYYGSDGVRSPLHFMRNPGEPEYDGAPPS